jgi:hypothetical protein
MDFPTTLNISDEQSRSTSAVQTLPLGTRGITPDGRVFAYAQCGATALEKYNVVSCPTITPLGTATQQFYEAYAAGTTHVVIDIASCTGYEVANYFRDGWVWIDSTDTGKAQKVRIHSHAAPASATALGQNTTWMLEPGGLQYAVGTDTLSFAKIIASPYRYVVAATISTGITNDDMYYIVGVTVCAVAANYYCWIQTWGPCLVRGVDGISAVSNWGGGLYAQLSSANPGMYCPVNVGTTATIEYYATTTTGNPAYFTRPIGIIMVPPFVSGGHALINLSISA